MNDVKVYKRFDSWWVARAWSTYPLRCDSFHWAINLAQHLAKVRAEHSL